MLDTANGFTDGLGTMGTASKSKLTAKTKLRGGKVAAKAAHPVKFSVAAAVARRPGGRRPRAQAGTPENREGVLAARLVDEVADDGPDVNRLCRAYGLRREELGRLTGFSLRALAEWSAGKRPGEPAKRRLQEVRRLLDALGEMVEPDAIPEWLRRPNAAFGRSTPLQVIEVGEIDRIWRMVHDLHSGQPE